MPTKESIAELPLGKVGPEVPPQREDAVGFANHILELARQRFSAMASDEEIAKRNAKNDSAELRARLASMDDAELLRFGRAAVFRLGRAAYLGDAGQQEYLAMRESRAEWRRRFRRSVIEDSF
jgi:hypothetical protein